MSDITCAFEKCFRPVFNRGCDPESFKPNGASSRFTQNHNEATAVFTGYVWMSLRIPVRRKQFEPVKLPDKSVLSPDNFIYQKK